jgi:signal transduction histidine kinase
MARILVDDKKGSIWMLLLGIILLIGLWIAKTYSYLLFHSLAELFSIVVACGVFMLAWNSRQLAQNTFLLSIGIAYLFISAFDLIHTLTYSGMGVFQGFDSNLPTQLWIAARYMESVSLLMASLMIGRKLKPGFVFSGYIIVTAVLLGSIFYLQIFPICFIEGTGLTAFKKVSEYIISLLLLVSGLVLFNKRDEFEPNVLRLLIAAIAVTISSELAFTLYTDPYGIFNILGHYLKIVSFYLVYKAIVETGLKKPFTLLFRDIKKSNDALHHAKENLELQVDMRTSELSQVNKSLQYAKENLELQVDMRTSELSQVNKTLREEISEHKRALENIKKLEIRLRQQQKLESIGTLASGVAHEINNPINGIMNYAQLMVDRLDADSPLKEFAKEIGNESERVAIIVRNLLTFSRLGKETHSPANIGDIVNDVFNLIRSLTHHDQITLKLDIPDELPKIKCRSQQIQQVLMNLLTNGRDALNERYSDYDENKILTVKVRPFEKHKIKWIRMTVEDHGTGIPDEIRERIFDPFFTTKDRTIGTGLGLSISYRIVEDHAGELHFESELGQYTRFHVDLKVENDWTIDNPHKEEINEGKE